MRGQWGRFRERVRGASFFAPAMWGLGNVLGAEGFHLPDAGSVSIQDPGRSMLLSVLQDKVYTSSYPQIDRAV